MTIKIDSFPGREIIVDGKPHLYFGGTAYLGLQKLPEFQELFIENIKRFGTNYGASRKSNVQLSVFDETENHLAKMVGAEACITFSSGYLVGQFISKFLKSGQHKFFYAPNTHTALYQKEYKNHLTYSNLLSALQRHINSSNPATPVIYLDSIDFSGVNYPDFKGLKSLPLKECIIVVDDSHGIGIVGENGQGVYKSIKELNPKKLFVCSSLGKGLGIQAGAVFGNRKDITEMSDTPFFGGASPASPAALNTCLQARTIYEERRKDLSRNINQFLEGLKFSEKFQFMPNYPVFSFSNSDLVAQLKKKNIVITDFNYPNENSETMSRIVILAAHTNTDIKKLVEVLNTFN